MRKVYIVCNTDDEPVMVFDNLEDAQMVSNADGLSSVIYNSVLFERGNDERERMSD